MPVKETLDVPEAVSASMSAETVIVAPTLGTEVVNVDEKSGWEVSSVSNPQVGK